MVEELSVKLRIVNITEEGRGGGPLNRIRLVAIALAKLNVETIVVCPNDADEFIADCKTSGLETKAIAVRVLSKNIGLFSKYLFSFPGDVFRLIQVIRELKPDIVHCNGSEHFKGIIAGMILRKRVIWHMTSTYEYLPIRIIFKIFSNIPNGYIFSSQRSMDYYVGLSKRIAKKSYALIPAPVDLIFSTDASLEDWEQDTFHVLTVAYINSNKGIRQIAEAALIFQNSHPELKIRFHIVGKVLQSQEGYFQEIRKFIDQQAILNIEFHGHQAQVSRFLKKANMYLCSSKFESSPMAVWEALACGLPIISSDVGDVKLILKEFDCGVLMANNDPQEIYKAIKEILPETQRIKEMSKNAILASKKFDVGQIAKDHQMLYNKIIALRPKNT